MSQVRMPLNQDIETLAALLNYIGRFLQWAVRESGRIRDPHLQRQFSEGLEEVLARLDSTVTELTEIETEEDRRYQELVNAGLTGQQLTIKTGVLGFITRVGSAIRHPFGWINAFLGSAAKAFPKLELVKEYKEHLELVVEQQHGDGPAPPQPVLGL